MVPLEMQHMVRACRPIIPPMGMYRQTMEEARTMRIACLPYLLKQMTRYCTRYRLLRRLWMTALEPLCQDLMEQILYYLPIKHCVTGLECFRTFWALQYDTLSVPVRMTQIAGMLHALGYTRMHLPSPDYEYEAYRMLAEKSNADLHYFDTLYHSLKSNRVVNKWPIVSSYMYKHQRLAWNKSEWASYGVRERLTLYLNACLRNNPLSPIELQLVMEWVGRMKYPSVGVDW